MEVWRNKMKGTYFIFIEDLDGKKIKLVTPDGDIKALEQDKFEGPFEQEECELITKALVTEPQLNSYKKYRRNLEEKLIEVIGYAFEGVTEEEMDKILENGTEEERMKYIRFKHRRVYRRLREKTIAINNLSDLLSLLGARSRE